MGEYVVAAPNSTTVAQFGKAKRFQTAVDPRKTDVQAGALEIVLD